MYFKYLPLYISDMNAKEIAESVMAPQLRSSNS